MTQYNDIILHMKSLRNADIAEHSQRFFKTKKGEYGYGDIFLGIRVPVLRQSLKLFQEITLSDIQKLLHSEYHEIRLLSLFMMVNQYSKGSLNKKEEITALYLENSQRVNNWDLVDSSAHYILGAQLFDKDRSVLYTLAESTNLWDRRIAIISTFYFIKKGDFHDTLALSKILLHDTEDLIHKAVGWMLREVGNRNQEREETFLKEHYKIMPRTMLRYAIEKFSPSRRKEYLKGEI